jgi:alkylation response protein AidB-like acyl-CoA dehydrogenase
MKTITIQSSLDLSDLESYLTENVDPHVMDWDRKQHFPIHVFEKLHDFGLVAACVPRDFGGTDLKTIDLMAIADCLAYHSTAICSGWITYVLFHSALSRFAIPSVAGRVISHQMNERSIVSLCGTEKETGTDILKMRTVALPVDGGYLISGKKHFITNINYAKHLVVIARVCDANGNPGRELSAFYIPADSKGVLVGPALQKMGQRESNTGQVEFSRVFVPKEHVLGKVGQGLEILVSSLSRTKTLIAGKAHGICRRAEKEAVTYLANTYRTNEQLLAKKEIQTILTELRAKIEAAWLLGCKAGAVWDEKKTAVYESSVAKFYSANVAMEFVQEALELMGASGYMEDQYLSKLYRDVKALEIYEGASLIQQALMARELFHPYLDVRKAKAA